MPTYPISYSERLPQVRRTFALFQDRVEVEAHWTFGKRFKSTVRLGDLSPQAKRHTIRNRWFKRAIMVGSLAVASALVFARPTYAPGIRRAAGFGWVVAGICLAVALSTYRKRVFLHFPRKDGKPGLDLCEMDTPQCHGFMQELRARIP